MAHITIDFETRSLCDLKGCGAWVYAEHPTTVIICLSYSFNSGEPKLWVPGDPDPEDLFEAALRGDWVVAHHAQFEKAIWTRIMTPVYGWPDHHEFNWMCTLAICARKQLPQGLDEVSRLLQLTTPKDKEGHAAMRKVCIPDKNGKFHKDYNSPKLLARTYSYCQTDVLSEDELLHTVGTLGKREQRVWELDQTINERGIKLDMPFVKACQSVIDQALIPLAKKFADLTGGLTASQTAKVLEWLNDRGANLPNMQKDVIEDYLDNTDNIPELVDMALRMRQKLTSASIKKLAAMRRAVGHEGRARGLLQYSAAGPGRWAGRIIQPHNFPRGVTKLGLEGDGQIDALVEAIMTEDMHYVEAVAGCPVDAVASSLRHAIVAGPGNVFAAGDFSTIEARIVLALAGQTDKLDLIESGADIYCAMASQIYGFEVNKKDHPVERQIGKNSVLGLGFQMGAPKFKQQVKKQTGLVIELDFAKKVVDTYREDFAPKVPDVWYGLQEAACKAVWDGTTEEAFGIVYKLEDMWLTARLPSGRKLYYWGPQKTRRPMPWDETDIRPGWSYTAKKMGRLMTIHAYGGLLTENVVQATARDLLVDRMFATENELGYPIVMTVHDEEVTEPEEWLADEKALQDVMEDAPVWARELGIPVAAECWIGDRYRK